MARKARKKASSGIYHVMLRGINKQDVFFDKNDFEAMLRSLEHAQLIEQSDGTKTRTGCTYYAYCILHNHLHLLVQEGELNVSEIMKRIQTRFVAIYNRKYERVGHLFQARFASEPVDKDSYFLTLLRYIHRNPVKAYEAKHPEDYPYSSWREYLKSQTCIIKGSDPLMIHLCDTSKAFELMSQDELVDWVNQPLDDVCLDMDTIRVPMTEVEMLERLLEISHEDSVEHFKQLSPDLQVDYIRQLVSQGASLRQAARMSSLSYRALWNRFHPEEYAAELERKKAERKQKREAKKVESSRGLTL